MKKYMKKREEILRALEKHRALKFNQLRREVNCSSNTLSNQLKNKEYGLSKLGYIEKVKETYEKKPVYKLTHKGERELQEINQRYKTREISCVDGDVAGDIIVQTQGKLSRRDEQRLERLQDKIRKELDDTDLKDASVSVRLKFWI